MARIPSANPLIRVATEYDAVQVQEIYPPYVMHTPISFEIVPPTVDEMRERLRNILAQLPWLVCESRGEMIGYVYGSPHHSRPAYSWSVDVAVYVRHGYHRFGVGRALYTSLFEVLRLQGFYNAYAGVTLPNPASVGLHEAMGFRPVGVYQAAGYKSGAWHDVGWWQLTLKQHSEAPPLPLGIHLLEKSSEWEAALIAGLPLLKLVHPLNVQTWWAPQCGAPAEERDRDI